mgnify:FL=1
MADIERENRKQELRSRVVDTKDLLQQEAEQKGKRRRSRRRFLVFLVVVLVLGALVAGAIYMMKRPYTGFSQNWRNSFNGENGVSESDYEDYEIFGDGFLKVTRDGATYIDSSGKTIWNQSYEMNSPYVSINGDYCAIADQGKTAIYIMNKTGTTGQAETNLPITKISVAGTGVTYALLEDSKASYITVFSKEGAALDISIKSVLDGDGYPVDIAVSPDGTELIASFASIENGTIQNKVIFYNLSEIGQNAGSNRVVGGFTDDFSGHLAGRVHFSDDTHAQAFYDGGIAFFSTKVLTSPELSQKVEIEQTIQAITYADDYIGVITDNSDSETSADPYTLTVYRLNGQAVFSTPFQLNYTNFDIDQDRVLVYNNTTLQLYDMSGTLKYSGNIDTSISRARVARGVKNPLGLDLLIGSAGAMESVKLK